MDKENKQAIVVLHEIYGINKFIKEMCRNFADAGYDVFCPDMIGRPPFSYEESKEAYDYFMEHIGFDIYKQINEKVNRLKSAYRKVFIVGFSAGATVAWECCENPLCDGIVGCYGSRIRDYIGLTPVSPVLLLFAKESSFNVDSVITQLKEKKQLTNLKFEACHGFIDSYSEHFDMQASKCAVKAIFNFLSQNA